MAKRPKRPRDINQLGKLTYNFARIHVTPAMETGVADHDWSLDEIARLAT